jgi:hypothetical protein
MSLLQLHFERPAPSAMSSTSAEPTLREARPEESSTRPLDPGFLDAVLPHLDQEFLMKSITEDKDQLKEKILSIQAE